MENSSSTLCNLSRTPTITRWMIASDLGRVFDILGLETPSTIIPKFYSKNHGRGKTHQFQHWIDSLDLLSSLAVPWYFVKDSFRQVNFSILCDSSEMSHGAAFYSRTTSDAGTYIPLLGVHQRRQFAFQYKSFVLYFWAVIT